MHPLAKIVEVGADNGVDVVARPVLKASQVLHAGRLHLARDFPVHGIERAQLNIARHGHAPEDDHGVAWRVLWGS